MPAVEAAEGEAAEIHRFVLRTCSDALGDGEEIDAALDLARAGLSSLSWGLIYTRLAQRFGDAVDAGLFTPDDGPLSVDVLVARLLDRLAVDAAAVMPPLPRNLSAQVMERLLAVGRAEVALEHAAGLDRGEFTSRRGQLYEYFERGSGPALIFLTALAFSKSVWEHQIRDFGADYRLVFPHLPGHAGSVYTGVGFTFEDLADDLVELMDVLGIGEAHVVGWCMAGNIAQLVALRHPRRLKSLALVCTTPTDARLRGLGQKELEDYSASPLRTYEMELNNIYQDEFLAAEVVESLATIKRSHVRVDPRTLPSFINGLFTFDTRDRLGRIGVPTLVVAGGRDIGFPADQVALLREGIGQAQFVAFDRSGHMPFPNQSADFNQALRAFLATVAASSRSDSVRHVPATPPGRQPQRRPADPQGAGTTRTDGHEKLSS